MKNHFRQLSLIALIGLCFGPAVFALGFRNPDQNARATGQGEAFVAQADDPSAVYYNPAGLTQVTGTEGMSGGSMIIRDIKFHPAGGGKSVSMNDPAYTFHLYASSDLKTDRWRLGFGINVPFGTSMNWGNDTPFANILTKANLTVINYAPTVAFKVNDHLSLGAGVSIYQGNTELEFNYDPHKPAGPKFKFEGSGVAVGGTFGVMWRITDQHTVGIVYRLPFSLQFDGTASVPSYPSAPANCTIQFPQSIAAGYAFRPTKKLKLEFDIEWTDWNTLNTVQLHSNNPTVTGDLRSALPFDWQAGFFYEFGVQYQINTNWVARLGYIFSENTVPDSTFGPMLPDSDRHVFSVGLGYTAKRWEVNLVYQYSLSADRTINNPPNPYYTVNGTWESQASTIMVTSAIKF
jgi:long-chain fatty acid transport protein